MARCWYKYPYFNHTCVFLENSEIFFYFQEGDKIVKTLFWIVSSVLLPSNAPNYLKYACFLEEKLWQHIKKQRHYFANKGLDSQCFGFFSSHVWMWELKHKEGWALKNGWFWTVVLEKTLESPLDCKEIKSVNAKGDQSWIFIGMTDAEAEASILWPPDAKSQLKRKDPDAGKDWGKEEKGTTEDEMVGWHHWFNGHEFGQAPGDGEVQGSLECCSP